MKIFIHAVAAKSGGAETQVRNLVGELAHAGRGHRYFLCVPTQMAKELRGRWDNVAAIGTDIGFKPKWQRFLWDQWTFRRIAKGADRILLVSDFGPLFPPCPQVLTLQNSLLFSPLYAKRILRFKNLLNHLGLRLRRRLIASLIRRSAVVTAASQSMLNDVLRFLPIPEGKLAINPFGVCADKFSPTRPAASGGPLRLLHVSEYGDYKNLGVLLRAIPLLSDSGLDRFYLTTTADPAQFPDVNLATRETDQALLADSFISPHVRNIGRVPYEEIHRLYQEHDLFLFPSIAESFGHPLVEAMSSGLPVVASDIPICREICGEAALYFDPWDSQDLARKILLMRSDEAMRRRLAKLGTARARSRFSWRSHATRLLQILENAGRKPPSTADLLLGLAASAGGPGRQTAGLSARQPPPDWDALYKLADRHQMVGILAPHLLQELDGSFPAEARSRWMDRWRTLSIRDLAQKAALQELLAAARGCGIRPMLLKGLAVHAQAYPKDAARGAFDIDLLVRPPDLPGMARCLEEAGFSFCGREAHGRPFPHWAAMLKRTHEAPFHRLSDGITVELHGSLCPPLEERLIGLRLAAQLWEKSREIVLGKMPCAIPAREEELLFLCLHLLKAEPFVLRNLSDILRLLHISPPVNWARFLHLMDRTGTGVFAHYAFEIASGISPGIVPGFVRKRLARFAGPRRLLSPSLRLERLVETHGKESTNLALRWRGIFFAQRPWAWLPYVAALQGKSALRKIGLC